MLLHPFFVAKYKFFLVLLPLLLALQPTVGFSLLSDFLPFCSFITLLSLLSYAHYLQIFFIHLFPGNPLVLVTIGFQSNILLGVLLSSIRITWPIQVILLLFINITMSVFSTSLIDNNSFGYWVEFPDTRGGFCHHALPFKYYQSSFKQAKSMTLTIDKVKWSVLPLRSLYPHRKGPPCAQCIIDLVDLCARLEVLIDDCFWYCWE
jgi:hypothetical protein